MRSLLVSLVAVVASTLTASVGAQQIAANSTSIISPHRQLLAQATCSLESDVDYIGNDIGSVLGAASDCCDKCSARSDCNAFTWTNYNSGTCWLKSGKGLTKASTGAKSAVVTTTSTPVGCSLEVGVDYVNNDIGNIAGATASDCCGKCSARSGCGAFSWTNYNGGTCWLKSGKGSAVTNAGVTSGVVTPTSAGCSTAEQNVDYVGNDIANVAGTGATDCCSKCGTRAGCGAFTWSSYNGGTCWLKSSKGTTKAATGVVSGVVTSSPPPTTPAPTTPAPTTSTPSTHIQYKIRSGEIPSRSVNLGGWLVGERWMSKTSPAWINVPDGVAYTGEYGVMQYLGKDQGTLQFENHRKTWITEKDISEIVDAGLNMVRVPVGFWIADEIDGGSTSISSVYARGSLKYLDTLINVWAIKYNVAVYLSLHAHQGSQNGYDHSAPQVMGQSTWSDSQANVDNSLRFATVLAARYKDAPAFVGLQLINEPAGTTNAAVRDNYYTEAYRRIRATGNNCIVGVSPMLYQQDQYVLRDFMRWPAYTNVWMEWHTYYKWGYENLSEDTIIAIAKTYRNTHFTDWPGNWVHIGEWSLGNGWNEEKFKDINKLKEFAAVQIQSYSEAHAGWSFWSWHHDDEFNKEADGSYMISGWNLRQLLQRGIFTIPK